MQYYVTTSKKVSEIFEFSHIKRTRRYYLYIDLPILKIFLTTVCNNIFCYVLILFLFKIISVFNNF